MIYVAMPLSTTAAEFDNAVCSCSADLDTFISEDQQAVADWAQARALQTRTDYQVFRLVETLYYKGKR